VPSVPTVDSKMQVYRTKRLGYVATTVGMGIVAFSILLYPTFLPKIITSENSAWIQQSSFIFYGLVFGSIILTAIGIHKMFKAWSHGVISSTNYPPSLSRIIINAVTDKKYFRFFWPASIGYGIFYAIVSAMLLYRTESFADTNGATIPSVVMMTYGPIGYVPTMAAYFTENIAVLIIPINLVVILVVSALVGFNTVLSIYAFKNRPKKTATPLFGALGATTSLFAACPTCASFYIFSIMAGSLAPTVAAFTATYYALFVAISIPLLLFTPFIIAFSIRRMMFGQCSLEKSK